MKNHAMKVESSVAATTTESSEKAQGANDNGTHDAAFVDDVANNRRQPITPAGRIPQVPDGYRPTEAQTRIRRFRRLATELVPLGLTAARQIQSKATRFESDLGDMAPDPAVLDAVVPEMEACEETLGRLRALLAYHEERYDILRGDLYTFLQQAHREYEHRVDRKPQLATEYNHLAELFGAVNGAIAEGIAQAKREKKTDG